MSDYLACPRCGLPCVREEVDIGVGIQCGPWRCDECGWHEPTGDELLIDTNDDATFEPVSRIVIAPPVTTAPGALRRIAYCRVCDRKISAETATANGGNCHAHAHSAIGVRWAASDDYRR